MSSRRGGSDEVVPPTGPERAPARSKRRRGRRRRVLLVAASAVLASACAAAVRVGITDGGGEDRGDAVPAPGPFDLRFDTVPPPSDGPAGDAGTPTVEARLLDDPNVRWVGTFDAEAWETAWGFNWGSSHRGNAREVPGVSRHGRVLDVVFNPDNLSDRRSTDARMGMNALGAFPLMGVPTMEEAWFRYYVYLPADWEAAGDGKMPGLAGNVDVLGSAGDTSGGGEYEPGSWSGRVMWNNIEVDALPSRPTPRTYLYVVSVGNNSIEDHRAENQRIYGFGARWEDDDGEPAFMELGEWNVIEVHYKMNTPGVEDGIFEGWLYNSRYPDGVRGAYHDDVQYRDAEHPTLGINQLQQAHYYGGAIGPRSAQHMYFDDFVISSAPVGPRRDG